MTPDPRAARPRRWAPWITAGIVLGITAGGFAATSATSRRAMDPKGVEIESLAAELESQRRSLDRREQTLAAKEQALAGMETRLIERGMELDAKRAQIDQLRNTFDAERNARVTSVIKSVGGMKPEPAAKAVAELDRKLAIEVLRGMPNNKVSKILAELPPAKAADLVTGLIGPGRTPDLPKAPADPTAPPNGAPPP
jgi:flagellar motility protein MotE (MotC chaperone)